MNGQADLRYDLFISHAHTDRAWVEGYLLPALGLPETRVITPRRFEPGMPPLTAFEQAIGQSHYTLLVLSTAYPAADWLQFSELLAAQLSVGAQGDRLLLALLEPCDLHLRLRFRERCDFTRPEAWEQECTRLRALVGRPLPGPEEIPCPYPGLVAFAEADAGRFFGRDRESMDLVRHLIDGPGSLVMVIGPSGCGKSSLVFAGLVPRLRSWKPDGWRVGAFRPGRTPLDNLRSAVGELLGRSLPAESAADGSPAAQRAEPAGAGEGLAAWLLIIDQFEELFVHAARSEQNAFIAALQALRRDAGLRVVLTMRADFYPDLMRSDLWPVEPGQRVELAPLRGQALRLAVEQPAVGSRVYLQSALLERLIADTMDEPGALPLLQATLRLLWEHRLRRFIPVQAYDQLAAGSRNGLVVAMSTMADAVLGTLPASQQNIARRIFLRLVQFGEGRPDIRRQQAVDELVSVGDDPAAFAATLRHLADGRLLTLTGEQDDPQRRVDLAHEALISGWPTLATWIRERREAEQTRRRLQAKGDEWVRLGSGQAGQLDQVELAEAERWLSSSDAAELGYGTALVALAAASKETIERAERAREEARLRELRQAQALAEEQRQRAEEQARSAKRFRRLAAALAVVFLIAAGAAVLARIQQNRADQQARTALSRQLAAQSRTYLQSVPDLALLLAVEGSRIDDTLEARGSLLDSLAQDSAQGPALLAVLRDHDHWVMDVAFTPAGNLLASAGADGRVVLWDAFTRQSLARLECGQVVRRITFSPDGKLLAAGLTNGDILLWDVEQRRLAVVLDAHLWDVRALAFSPNGRTLASGGDDQKVMLWDVATGRPAGLPLSDGELAAHDLAFSPDGRLLAAGTSAGLVGVWNAETRLPVIAPFEAHQGAATSVTFSPDGQLLVSAGRDALIRLWDAATWQLSGSPLAGHEYPVEDVTFSPNGALLASAGEGDTVLLWDVGTRLLRGSPLQAHNDAVHAVAFSPDGTLLASGGKDKSVALWQLVSALPLAEVLTRDTAAMDGVVFSAQGEFLVSRDEAGVTSLWDAGDRRLLGQEAIEAEGLPNGLGLSHDGVVAASNSEGTISLWDTTGSQPMQRLAAEPASALGHVAFSADGVTAAVGREDGSVALWDLQSGRQLDDPLQGGEAAVMSVAFSRDESTLAAGDDNGNVYLWDLASRRLLQRYPLHTDTVWALAFSPDGRLLASGSSDDSIGVTDPAGGAGAALVLERHGSWVYALAFDPSGAFLASGSRDDTILLWDVARGEPLGAPLIANTGDVFALAFSPDGQTLSAGSAGPETLVLWDVGLASWQARACRIANRNLSVAEWERFISPGIPYRCTCPELAPGQDTSLATCPAGE